MNSLKPIKKDKTFKFNAKTIKELKVYNMEHESIKTKGYNKRFKCKCNYTVIWYMVYTK